MILTVTIFIIQGKIHEKKNFTDRSFWNRWTRDS